MLSKEIKFVLSDRIKCLYHANCADGFTSAWVVDKYFKTMVDSIPISFHPCFYNQEVPVDLDKNDIVLMVDFCYTPEVMEQIFEKAKFTIVLDHHKSAIDRMDKFLYPDQGQNVPWYLEFDIDRSGAGITWDYLFQDVERPAIIQYVEDRDLWRFAFPDTRAINANLFSFEYTFDNWNNIANALENPVMHKAFVLAGEAIERKHFKDIKEFLFFHTNRMKILGHVVPVVSVPYCWSSDSGNLLCKEFPGYVKPPFAAAFWFIKEDKIDMPRVQFSLRSIGDFDVAKIAEKFKGGGHKNAAGFTVSFEIFKEMLNDFQWQSEE